MGRQLIAAARSYGARGGRVCRVPLDQKYTIEKIKQTEHRICLYHAEISP